MIPVALVVRLVGLTTRLMDLVPKPDPALRRLRVKHTQEMRRLRAGQHHERAMARIARRRRG